MPATSLDAETRAELERAIAALEARSAVEVVIAVRRRAAPYLHAHVVAGAVAAFAGLAAMLFVEHPFALTAIWIDPFVAAMIAASLVALIPAAQRALTPVRWRQRAVLEAARSTFVVRGVHRTRARTGLLVYIARLEREVALVPDLGLDRALPADVLEQHRRALTTAFARGPRALATALLALGDPLEAHAPRAADDINELPDAIDDEGAR